MAESQFGSVKACFTFFGSQWVRRSEGLILGRWIPDLDLVCIGWVLGGLGGEGGNVWKWRFCGISLWWWSIVSYWWSCLCSIRRLNRNSISHWLIRDNISGWLHRNMSVSDWRGTTPDSDWLGERCNWVGWGLVAKIGMDGNWKVVEDEGGSLGEEWDSNKVA